MLSNKICAAFTLFIAQASAISLKQEVTSEKAVADFLESVVQLAKVYYPDNPTVQDFTIVEAIEDGIPFTSVNDSVGLLEDSKKLGFSFTDLDTQLPYTSAQLRVDLNRDYQDRVKDLIPGATECNDFSCFVAMIGNAGHTSDEEAFSEAWFVEQEAKNMELVQALKDAGLKARSAVAQDAVSARPAGTGTPQAPGQGAWEDRIIAKPSAALKEE